MIKVTGHHGHSIMKRTRHHRIVGDLTFIQKMNSAIALSFRHNKFFGPILNDADLHADDISSAVK